MGRLLQRRWILRGRWMGWQRWIFGGRWIYRGPVKLARAGGYRDVADLRLANLLGLVHLQGVGRMLLGR